jgi:hypothetical protein
VTAPVDVDSISDGLARLGMTANALWLGYFAVGGNGSLSDVERWLAGDTLTGREYDLLAAALNEAFTERGLDHPVRYREA